MPYLGNTPPENFVNVVKQDITGDGGQNYSLNHPVVSAADLEVFVNNVQQEPTTAYTVSGSTLTFDEAVSATDDIYVIFRARSIGTAHHPADLDLNAQTGTFSRAGTEGSALTLQKDGTTFGTLGVDGSDLVIDGPSGHTGLRMTTSGLLPRQNGAIIDNTIDLGSGGYRYNDLYLGGQAFANVIGRSDDTNTTIDFPGSDLIEAYTAGVKRMDIDANGNTTLKCAAGDSNQALSAWHPTSTSGRTIARFQSNVGGTQTTKFIVRCSGDTGIGTTTTSFRLNVVSSRSDYVAQFDRNVNIDTSFRNFIKFARGGTAVGEIKCSNTATQYGTSSDHRLKENVEDMTGAIARVKQLSPKRFSWIVDELDSPNFDGFLAHEAQAVVPQAVSGTHNAVDDDGEAVMQGIDHSMLVPLLTAALKEAVAKIETLETKVAALEGN